MSAYRETLPLHADVSNLACYFEADYDSFSRRCPPMIDNAKSEVEKWRERWLRDTAAAPVLAITRLSEKTFMLRDTRGIEGTQETQFLNREEATQVLVEGVRLSTSEWQWVLHGRLGIKIDGTYVPLATANAELIKELTTEARQRDSGRDHSCPEQARLTI